jgi:cation transport ATPase
MCIDALTSEHYLHLLAFCYVTMSDIYNQISGDAARSGQGFPQTQPQQQQQEEENSLGQWMRQSELLRQRLAEQRSCIAKCCTKEAFAVFLIVWWIGSLIAPNVCCNTSGLPEHAHLSAQMAVVAYGIISLAVVLIGGIVACAGGVSIHTDNREAGIGLLICGGASALTFIGLYLWIFFVALILLARHFHDQPMGLNILLILTDVHILFTITAGMCVILANR